MRSRAHIPAPPHPLCLVAALADSPVAWSRRALGLGGNAITSVSGVIWPSSLVYVSPLACSERARSRIPAPAHPLCLVAAMADSPVAWSLRYLNLDGNAITSVTGVSWPPNLEYVSPQTCSARQSTHPCASAPRLPRRRARARIPAPPHPLCLVAALAYSPVAWSRRDLDLSYNAITNVSGVILPSSLKYVSPLACSALQSTHPCASAPPLPRCRAG